jgi:hypothetical protein
MIVNRCLLRKHRLKSEPREIRGLLRNCDPTNIGRVRSLPVNPTKCFRSLKQQPGVMYSPHIIASIYELNSGSIHLNVKAIIF